MGVSQKLILTPHEPSIENNTTKLRILWTSTQTGASYNDYKRTGYYYVSVNGGAETKYSVSYTLPKGSTKTIADATLLLRHDVEGKCTVKVRTYMDTGISAGVVELTETLEIDQIPRKSTLNTINGTLGHPQILEIIRTSDIFTHTITYTCGEISGEINIINNDNSAVWTPPLKLATENISGNTVRITLTITTYNGSDIVGTSDTTITAGIPPTVKPTAQLTIYDPTGYATKYGGYVQDKSQVTVELMGTGAQGSEITSHEIYIGEIYHQGDSKTTELPESGDIQITGTVKDSRLRKDTAADAISVLKYKPPKVTDLTAYRCDVNGNEDGDGTYFKVTFSAEVSALGNNNSASYKLQYRQIGATDWTEHIFSTAEDDYSPVGVSIKKQIGSGKSFELRIVASDDFGSVNSALRTIAGIDIFEADENGFTVNPPLILRSGVEEISSDKKKSSREAFGLNQLLWEGMCNVGNSITVDNLQEYCIYRIEVEDYAVSIIAIRQDDTKLSGWGGTHISGTDGPRICTLQATIDGDVLSLTGGTVMDHINGAGRIDEQGITITSIYGLL